MRLRKIKRRMEITESKRSSPFCNRLCNFSIELNTKPSIFPNGRIHNSKYRSPDIDTNFLCDISGSFGWKYSWKWKSSLFSDGAIFAVLLYIFAAIVLRETIQNFLFVNASEHCFFIIDLAETTWKKKFTP